MSLLCSIGVLLSTVRADEPTTRIPTEPTTTVYEKHFHRLNMKGMPPEALASYSAIAMRLGARGTVSLAYSVDASGKAVRIALVSPLTPTLESAAVDMLQHATFEVPADWANTDGPAHRYQFRVQFAILATGEKMTIDRDVDVVITAMGQASGS
jgi:outer membrane biosynthesis protein TonB